MPKYRKLHVKATVSEDINEMPDDFHRLLWVMLPLGLDREGRALDNPAFVKARVMPLRNDVTHEMIEAALSWFAARGMIERYQVNGRRYFWTPTFEHYQGDTKRESPSEYPAPPDPCSEISRPTRDLVASRSSTDSDSDTTSDADADATSTSSAADAAAAPAYDPEIEAIATAWEDVTGKPNTAADCQTLIRWLDEYPRERILYGIEQAHLHGALKLAYVYRVLVDGGAPRASPSGNGNGNGPPQRETTLDRSKRVIQEMLGAGDGNSGDGRQDAAAVGRELAQPRDYARNRAALPGGPG